MNTSGIKKNTARLILKGISILGILFGAFFVFFAIILSLLALIDDIDAMFIWLFIIAVFFLLGAYMIYTSYRMFRWRSFGAIKAISVVLALYSWASSLAFLDAATSFSDKLSGYIGDIIFFVFIIASWLIYVLVYIVCVRLLKGLLAAANRSEEISETE
jgi:hypothetical protein